MSIEDFNVKIERFVRFEGADISKLIKEKRKFYAKLDMFGTDKWFRFENNKDINILQEVCCSEGSVEWYYDDDNIEQQLSSSS